MTHNDFSKRYVNLAQPRLGAAVTYASDDFFADKARLINPEAPVFIPGKYDDNGKWMDGWESRRKRGMGHDHCIIRLGQPGVIRGVDIDTSHFTGNFPPAASIDACVSDEDIPGEDGWTEIVAATNLTGDSHHLVPVNSDTPWTHLRLNIFPVGGVARLRVYGTVFRTWTPEDAHKVVDLASLVNGGRAVVANNEHFGILANLLAPGRGINMGDGWGTRRRREPGNDWAIIGLGHAGRIEDILVDTAYFKGNFPSGISLQGALVTGGTDESLTVESQFWPELLAKQPLSADSEHPFKPTANPGPISHVRINIFPDGGVSRLRLFGKPELT
jgi:allantoicase